jgi:hypothetical protein
MNINTKSKRRIKCIYIKKYVYEQKEIVFIIYIYNIFEIYEMSCIIWKENVLASTCKSYDTKASLAEYENVHIKTWKKNIGNSMLHNLF